MYRIKLKDFKSANLYWSVFHDCYVESGKGEQLYNKEAIDEIKLEPNQEWQEMEISEFDVHMEEI